MPRYRYDGEIVDAVRYQPGHGGHVIHRLSENGISCIHLQPDTEAISIFDDSGMIDIEDPRHDFAAAEAMIHPGDWIVWRGPFDLAIVSSRVFEADYVAIG